MINSTNASLETPLSPPPRTSIRRTVFVQEKRSRLLYLIPIFLLTIGIGFVAYHFLVVVPLHDDAVSTTEAKTQIRGGFSKITIGEYEICNWETISLETVPIYKDGQDNGFFDPTDDILIEGVICDSNPPQEVILALDDEGLHGSIAYNGTTEVMLTALDADHSKMETFDRVLPSLDIETEKTIAAGKKFDEFWRSQQKSRSSLIELAPGSVDIHLHLDVDSQMVTDAGSEFAAARYAVELIAVVNKDAFVDLGFNLKVVSINIRSDFLSQTSSSSAYLDELEKIPRPTNVNLLHSLTSRRIGGGIAYIGGLYHGSRTATAVSGNLRGGFSLWDRYVVAHELGHNFGTTHTHEYDPPVGTCGTTLPICASLNIGTIMSYCHACRGGLNNIRYEWAPAVREKILNMYQSLQSHLVSRTECRSLPTTPDAGVPFYLKSVSQPAAWQYDGARFVALRNENYCWQASENCDAIALGLCAQNSKQIFIFTNGGIQNPSCGILKSDNGQAQFSNGTTIVDWCHLENADGEPGTSCDDEITNISCGDVKTGSTVNACNGEKLFKFIAPASSLTISICQSAFDTMLSVETSDTRVITTRVITGNDEGHCGNETVLEDLTLDSGVEYDILLSGYNGATGNFRMEVTCDVPPTCVFGCEPVSITCSKRDNRQIAAVCHERSPCSVEECQDRCAQNEECNFLFTNIRGGCMLYRACDRTRRPGDKGVTYMKVVAIETTGAFEDVYGSWEGNPTQTTCSSSTTIAKPCTSSRICDRFTCQNYCENDSQCEYFFSNVLGGCWLHSSCTQTRKASNAGWTRQKK